MAYQPYNPFSAPTIYDEELENRPCYKIPKVNAENCYGGGVTWIIPLKIELHAHLHGSIRESTLLDLAEQRTDVRAKAEDAINGKRTLDTCFKLFGLIHR